MNLKLNETSLQRVGDITIPDIFYRRMKTGISRIDNLFDEGILPGSSYTLTAKAGCGKTTLMLQVLNGLVKNGYKIGYFSGEESIYQLAYTANRVQSTDVSIANVTDIDTIVEHMKDLDFIVVDSFQALTTSSKMNSRQLEKYAVQTLVREAKKHECVVLFVMHLTKSGDLKGGTIVPHTVDANIKIATVPDADTDDARVIYFEKNRFGPCNELECTIGPKGYDFDSVVVRDEEDKPSKAPSKADRRKADIDKLLNFEGVLTLATVTDMLDGNFQRAQLLLRELVITNKLVKMGRGVGARWVIVPQNK